MSTAETEETLVLQARSTLDKDKARQADLPYRWQKVASETQTWTMVYAIEKEVDKNQTPLCKVHQVQ